MNDFQIGFLVGVLVGEGSFGGDGRQPAITVRMHVRHEAMFRYLHRLVAGSRLYGPYHHSGRSYFQWLIRGQSLRGLLPVLDRHLVPDLDEHAWRRYEAMKTTYRLQSPSKPVEGD
ncbi:MAG TPA: hypothetical protein VNE62_10220 [Actinomycetota bacterium]|nr:hypothetical protein [Actinomycetota bacterium]